MDGRSETGSAGLGSAESSCFLPGIRTDVREQGGNVYRVVESDLPLRTLNTSVWGGGFGFHRYIVNRQVHKSYDSPDPEVEMGLFLEAEGLPVQETCALMTAAYVRDGGYAEELLTWEEDGRMEVLRVAAWVTAGLGNTARAGELQPPEKLYPGTVNTIVVVDGRMTDAAMAGALITATEAKAAAFQELDIRSYGTGSLATGTTTDAVLLAATGRGRRPLAYAGLATRCGYLIGRTVHQAALVACRRYLERCPR